LKANQVVSMATSSATKVVTAHLPEDLASKLDSFAETRERSRGWVVKQAIRSYIEWEEEKDRLTIEALEEADRIGTIPHEEVVAWAKSLSTDNPLPTPEPRKG
jgi:predicted transcriptional regulator